MPPRPKKDTPQVVLSPIDGLPELPYNKGTGDEGTCPSCVMPARVRVHARGGFYVHCRHCGFRGFTSTHEGAVLFRAMQRLLRDPDLNKVLKDSLLLESKQIEDEMQNRIPGEGRPA